MMRVCSERATEEVGFGDGKPSPRDTQGRLSAVSLTSSDDGLRPLIRGAGLKWGFVVCEDFVAAKFNDPGDQIDRILDDLVK